MWAAEKGQLEVCVKLAELGADLNKADWVRKFCPKCISVCCFCLIIMFTLFLELEWHDRFDVGC